MIEFMKLLVFKVTMIKSTARKFDYRKGISDDYLNKIYSQYLSDKSLNPECRQKGKTSDITEQDFNKAVQLANQQLSGIRKFDQDYLGRNPSGKQFDSLVYEASLQSKLHQFVTKNLVNE